MESKASDLHPHQAEQPARARSPAKDDQNSAKAEESGVARRVCSAGRRTAMLAVIEEGRKGASAVPPAVPPASEAGRAAPRRETLLAVAGAGAGGWRRRGRLDGLIAGTQSRSGKGKKEETVSESVSGRESERASERTMDVRRKGRGERETLKRNLVFVRQMALGMRRGAARGGVGGNGAVNAGVRPQNHNREGPFLRSFCGQIGGRRQRQNGKDCECGTRRHCAAADGRAGGPTFTRFSYTRGKGRESKSKPLPPTLFLEYDGGGIRSVGRSADRLA